MDYGQKNAGMTIENIFFGQTLFRDTVHLTHESKGIWVNYIIYIV